MILPKMVSPLGSEGGVTPTSLRGAPAPPLMVLGRAEERDHGERIAWDKQPDHPPRVRVSPPCGSTPAALGRLTGGGTYRICTLGLQLFGWPDTCQNWWKARRLSKRNGKRQAWYGRESRPASCKATEHHASQPRGSPPSHLGTFIAMHQGWRAVPPFRVRGPSFPQIIMQACRQLRGPIANWNEIPMDLAWSLTSRQITS